MCHSGHIMEFCDSIKTVESFYHNYAFTKVGAILCVLTGVNSK